MCAQIPNLHVYQIMERGGARDLKQKRKYLSISDNIILKCSTPMTSEKLYASANRLGKLFHSRQHILVGG